MAKANTTESPLPRPRFSGCGAYLCRKQIYPQRIVHL